MTIYKLSEKCAVAGQIELAEVANLAAEGYTTIICNRPDFEDAGQPTAAEMEETCAAQGLAFHHIPIAGNGLSMDVVARFRDAVGESTGPVLAYCRSGQRSSVIWQASGSP